MKIATKKAVEKTQPLKYMNYLFAFLGRDFQLNHTGTATKIVETQPETTPTAIGIATKVPKGRNLPFADGLRPSMYIAVKKLVTNPAILKIVL